MAKSFVAAINGFFGRRPNTSIQDFNSELKSLSHPEKLEFAEMLRTQPGFEDTLDPLPPTVQK